MAKARELAPSELRGIRRIHLGGNPSIVMRHHLWALGYIEKRCKQECCWKLTRRGLQAIERLGAKTEAK